MKAFSLMRPEEHAGPQCPRARGARASWSCPQDDELSVGSPRSSKKSEGSPKRNELSVGRRQPRVLLYSAPNRLRLLDDLPPAPSWPCRRKLGPSRPLTSWPAALDIQKQAPHSELSSSCATLFLLCRLCRIKKSEVHLTTPRPHWHAEKETHKAKGCRV